MIHIQVSDMNIRERLIMSRPSPHQRRSLKETYTNSLKKFLIQLIEVKPPGKSSWHKLFHSFIIRTKYEACKVLVLLARKVR